MKRNTKYLIGGVIALALIWVVFPGLEDTFDSITSPYHKVHCDVTVTRYLTDHPYITDVYIENGARCRASPLMIHWGDWPGSLLVRIGSSRSSKDIQSGVGLPSTQDVHHIDLCVKDGSYVAKFGILDMEGDYVAYEERDWEVS